MNKAYAIFGHKKDMELMGGTVDLKETFLGETESTEQAMKIIEDARKQGYVFFSFSIA